MLSAGYLAGWEHQAASLSVPVLPPFELVKISTGLPCVCAKGREELVRAFDAVNRIDLTEATIGQIIGQEGVVAAKHATNGIEVSFDNLAKKVWLEPMCLFHVGVPPRRDDTSDTRFFPGQKVRATNSFSISNLRVGTIELRSPPVEQQLVVR